MGEAELRGRRDEIRRIERLLAAAAREGESGALLIHGEAGIGKTALLDHAAERAAADGMRVLRIEGVESETELAFGGLHQLFRPVLHLLDRLPAPQSAALRALFGLTDDAVQDRFTVGLAALSTLAEAAAGQPLLCVIDDVQWLDQPSADVLAFAARRLCAEGVVMLFGLRDGVRDAVPDGVRDSAPPPPRLKGIPRLALTGLDRRASVALLAGLLPPVAERIADQAHGNPLALRVLADALTPAQRAGRLGPLVLPEDTSPLPDLLAEQIARLPAATRWMLTVAAADDTGDLAVVVRAAGRPGGAPADLKTAERGGPADRGPAEQAALADLEPAEQAGLVRLSAEALHFGHPLIRYAAYQSAPLARRLAAHRALASALDPVRHAHRRAWHLAAAATGPDEDVAGELERVAEWAGSRQAMASASAAYERAAQLTADPRLRARRLIDAAQKASEAGQDERCRTLAEQVPLPLQDPALAADFARVRAVVELGYGSPAQAARILLACADEIGAARPDRLAPLLADAIHAALSAGDATLLSEIATRAPHLPVLTVPAWLFAADTPDAQPPDLVRAGAGARTPAGPWPLAPTGDGVMDRLLAGHYAHLLADHARAHEHAAAAVDRCRERGAGGWLPTALDLLARVEAALGRTDDAQVHAAEGLRLADYYDLDHRAAHLRARLALLAAAQGREAETRASAEEALAYTRPRGVGRATADALRALGLLELGLGSAESALALLQAAAREVGHPALAQDLLPDLVEAAVRAGRVEEAREPASRLAAWAAVVRRPALTALSRRCAALTGPDEDAEGDFVAALDLHAHEPEHRPITDLDPDPEPGREPEASPYQLARTALLYGEWLRRRRRPIDAREHLRTAMELFARHGAAPWADRARTELEAAGESHDPPVGADPRVGRLSPQEREVVRLAATGATNREIATQLFLSPRTVGHHLYRAFPKLGINSRTELADLLA